MISILFNLVSVNNYEKLIIIESELIKVLVNKRYIDIIGHDLYVSFISEDEIIIKGSILEVKINENL